MSSHDPLRVNKRHRSYAYSKLPAATTQRQRERGVHPCAVVCDGSHVPSRLRHPDSLHDGSDTSSHDPLQVNKRHRSYAYSKLPRRKSRAVPPPPSRFHARRLDKRRPADSRNTHPSLSAHVPYRAAPRLDNRQPAHSRSQSESLTPVDYSILPARPAHFIADRHPFRSAHTASIHRSPGSAERVTILSQTGIRPADARTRSENCEIWMPARKPRSGLRADEKKKYVALSSVTAL
ncbi:hypothetical protein HYPSUDRAFT_200543 [Hypholoma sublateritium FD-334 SS-4]|uniref:Uncharacterized protein n=1 Tax=Hypholoma sublateritium (strain FD-334 SS-4) TaxID=945553 RepID=A0A0D2PZC6_HYPSF|nr:hypothetical protein HYPSUDRAFT_200543 [Hypholoma sublateritium FD-334 SS-4]